MKLLDYDGNVLEWAADEAGEHSTVIYVGPSDDKQSRLFVLRPDDALALGSALVAWAKHRMAKGGLF